MPRRLELDTNEEIVRLLVAMIRMRLDSQSAVITELSRAGLGSSRIADLLGTTAGTVNVALQRAKKAAEKSSPKGAAS